MHRLVCTPILCDAGSRGTACLISIKSAMAFLAYCQKATLFSVQTCKRGVQFLLELQNTVYHGVSNKVAICVFLSIPIDPLRNYEPLNILDLNITVL